MASQIPTAAPPTVLRPEDHGRPVSAEEFASAEFLEPWKYERQAGRLLVMSPDGADHDECSEPLRDHLGAYRLAHPDRVRWVVSEAWVRVDEGTDRIGDIGVYLAAGRDDERRPRRAPEIMFEIVSGGRTSRDRDYVEKRAEYHRLGIREYVIVDRFAGNVTVLAHTPDGYVARVLTRAEVYETPLLPGLAIPLHEVLPR